MPALLPHPLTAPTSLVLQGPLLSQLADQDHPLPLPSSAIGININNDELLIGLVLFNNLLITLSSSNSLLAQCLAKEFKLPTF